MSAVLILGGGLAGGAAAARLARQGIAVQLIEREAEPRDKICGEFLSIEAQRHLGALGLDPARLGGVPIARLRLAAGDRLVETALPFTALGLTRRRLDAALLDHAATLGAHVERGISVRAIGSSVETSAGSLSARRILLATGKHDVRGIGRAAPGTIRDLIGFKQYFRLSPAQRAALAGHIEVVLFAGGYAGLQLVEGGIANLCLLVEGSRFAALGSRWPALLAALLAEPHLARRLDDAEPLLPRPLTIAGVPYGFVHRADPADAPGLYRLGDQAAVIPSFAGDGMAIALHSGRLAADAIAAGAGAATYHARLAGDVARQVRLATLLQRFGRGVAGRATILTAAALAPAVLGALASLTRLPEPALRRAGLA